MIFIQTDKHTNLVTMIHYMPFDSQYGIKDDNGKLLTEEQIEEIGFLVDNLPKVEKIKGKRPIMSYSKEEGFQVTYIDIPKIDYSGVPQSMTEKIQDDLVLSLIDNNIL